MLKILIRVVYFFHFCIPSCLPLLLHPIPSQLFCSPPHPSPLYHLLSLTRIVTVFFYNR